MTSPIRVLVVDDSRTVRAALRALLSRDPALEVVGEAEDGEAALGLAAALRPDVVTMDLVMPGMGGIEAIRRLMERSPCRVLAVAAVEPGRETSVSFEAIEAGALELVSKPRTGAGEIEAWGAKVAEAVRLMAEIPVVTRRRAGPPSWPSPPPPSVEGRVSVVGLVASTGGPPALARILEGLPPGLAAPVLVAQHLMAGFGQGLTRWLAGCTRLRVEVARDGEGLRPGHVYLPPDRSDLELASGWRARVVANRGGHCPSGDRLLESLARHAGKLAAGVVLTGMGEDGAQGLLALRNAGGATLAQDRDSSIVYGMPQAAARLGAAVRILPLEAIATALLELCGTGGDEGRP